VSIVGDGILLEEHARLARTITYELACGLDRKPERTRREVLE
jgi:alanine racemase